MKYKKNHYVPESYLRRFASVRPGERNPMLYVYDKDGNVPRRQSPKDTAAITDLYTISHEDMPPHALEEAFGKQESAVSPILDRWRKPGAVPQLKEIPEVAYFVALLHLRNPKTAKWYEAMAEVMTIERAVAVARNDDEFDATWNAMLAEGKTSIKDVTKEQVRERLLAFDKHFILKFDEKYTTLSPLKYADDVYDELVKMYWCLCTAPDGIKFIASDSPVVVRFKKGDGFGFGGGFGHPTVEVTFPISPNVSIRLTRHNRYKKLLVKSDFVKEANRRMAINAERYVFAQGLTNGIESLVKKYSFTRQNPRVDKEEILAGIKERQQRRSGQPGGSPEAPTEESGDG